MYRIRKDSLLLFEIYTPVNTVLFFLLMALLVHVWPAYERVLIDLRQSFPSPVWHISSRAFALGFTCALLTSVAAGPLQRFPRAVFLAILLITPVLAATLHAVLVAIYERDLIFFRFKSMLQLAYPCLALAALPLFALTRRTVQACGQTTRPYRRLGLFWIYFFLYAAPAFPIIAWLNDSGPSCPDDIPAYPYFSIWSEYTIAVGLAFAVLLCAALPRISWKRMVCIFLAAIPLAVFFDWIIDALFDWPISFNTLMWSCANFINSFSVERLLWSCIGWLLLYLFHLILMLIPFYSLSRISMWLAKRFFPDEVDTTDNPPTV